MKMENILMTMSMLTSIMTIFTKSLMSTWLLMEISNLTLMMSMLMNPNSKKSTPIMFIVQASSSMIMLMSMTMSVTTMNFMMMTAISMKMGMFPFHSVTMPLIKSLSMSHMTMFTTINKMPPLMMIQNNELNLYITTTIMITPMIMMIKGYASPLNMHMFAVSSSIHSSWMLILSMYNTKSLIIYMTIYSAMMMIMITNMKTKKSILSPYSMSDMNMMKKMILTLMMMSTPPMLTFMMKIEMMATIIQSSTNKIMMITLATYSTMASIMYTRIMIKPAMTQYSPSKVTKKKKINSISIMVMILTTPMIMAMMMM